MTLAARTSFWQLSAHQLALPTTSTIPARSNTTCRVLFAAGLGFAGLVPFIAHHALRRSQTRCKTALRFPWLGKLTKPAPSSAEFLNVGTNYSTMICAGVLVQAASLLFAAPFRRSQIPVRRTAKLRCQAVSGGKVLGNCWPCRKRCSSPSFDHCPQHCVLVPSQTIGIFMVCGVCGLELVD